MDSRTTWGINKKKQGTGGNDEFGIKLNESKDALMNFQTEISIWK